MASRHLLIDLGNSSLKGLEIREPVSSGKEINLAPVCTESWSNLKKLDRSSIERVSRIEPCSWESVEHLALERLSDAEQSTAWHIASVNPPALHQLLDRLSRARPNDSVRVLGHTDFPMKIDVDFPERVGLDRLAAATAARFLKKPYSAAIVIDAGTATTVDAVSVAGDFLGGAILASASLMLKSLGAHTRLLPTLRDDAAPEAPTAIGRNTEAALRSGAFWGQVGAIQTLLVEQQKLLGSEVEVMLCGGVSKLLESQLRPKPQRWPGLVLGGIAVASASAEP